MCSDSRLSKFCTSPGEGVHPQNLSKQNLSKQNLSKLKTYQSKTYQSSRINFQFRPLIIRSNSKKSVRSPQRQNLSKLGDAFITIQSRLAWEITRTKLAQQ
jgi:hypothetical protein